MQIMIKFLLKAKTTEGVISFYEKVVIDRKYKGIVKYLTKINQIKRSNQMYGNKQKHIGSQFTYLVKNTWYLLKAEPVFSLRTLTIKKIL